MSSLSRFSNLGPAVLDSEREILRQASIALLGRVVTLWEVSPDAELAVRQTSVPNPPYHATVLDVDQTLSRWKAPLVPGGRFVGCRLNETDWCVAPVRSTPAAPPPGGVERRSRERVTLELAGLCVGATEGSERLARAGLEHGQALDQERLADPITVALASLGLAIERLEAEANLDAAFRATLLDELVAVAGGLELSRGFVRSLEARSRGDGCHLRFDPAEVVHACAVLERPAARRRGAVLHLVDATTGDWVVGDPNALSSVLRSLIRDAVGRSASGDPPIVVRLEPAPGAVQLSVEERRISHPGAGNSDAGLGTAHHPESDLALLRRLIYDTCRGQIDLHSLSHGGRAATILLPRSAQGLPGLSGVGAAN